MSIIDQRYDFPPPRLREDIPAWLIGYEQVEGVIVPLEREIKRLEGELTQAKLRETRRERDMEAVRGLIPQAIEAWSAGKDDEARQLLTDAAARAASQ